MISTEPTAWNDALLKNPHAVADKRRRVQQMFAAIAPSYDLNNRYAQPVDGSGVATQGGETGEH